MFDPNYRELAETVFQPKQRREAEINNPLKQEEARHAAVVNNMQRLKALRLSREDKATSSSPQ